MKAASCSWRCSLIAGRGSTVVGGQGSPERLLTSTVVGCWLMRLLSARALIATGPRIVSLRVMQARVDALGQWWCDHLPGARCGEPSQSIDTRPPTAKLVSSRGHRNPSGAVYEYITIRTILTLAFSHAMLLELTNRLSACT